MASNTYVALDTKVLGTAAASVTFSSIPQGYTDLVLVIGSMQTTSDSYIYMQFNTDTTNNNYSMTNLLGDGSSASSGRASGSNSTVQRIIGYGRSASNTPSQINVSIMNYANTTTYKTWLNRAAATNVAAYSNVGLWRSTAAIDQIVLTPNAGSFSIGSTFTLYGIASTPGGTGTAKATGGTIYYDSFGYVYHKFTSNGTFTPSQSLTCDYVVVGGGGGTSWGTGGGGGAGGLRSTVSVSGGGGNPESPLALTSGTGYTVTVGAAGAGTTTRNAQGGSGGSSTFATITAAGGGGGGGNGTNAATGGSGGGGSGTGLLGAGTSGQGFSGGAGADGVSVWTGGGGGGGAGAAGQAAAVRGALYAGNGGDGVYIPTVAAVTSSGSGGYYAGGGGGGGNGNNATAADGVGGLGGGGNGSNVPGRTTAGATNTGGGAGGSGDGEATGKNGGSGIVIVRYYGL